MTAVRLGLIALPYAVAWMLLAALPAAAHAAAASPLDACAPPAGESWTRDRLLCVYNTAKRYDRLAEAREWLQRLGAGRAGHPWPTMVLGYVALDRGEPQALTLFELAATDFARLRDAEGEVLARHNLRDIYQRRNDAAGAARQVAEALETAEASGQAMPIARASVLAASHEIQTGGDIGRAYRTLQRARQFAFPTGPIGLRRTILFNLANASLYLGRLDEAGDALQRHRALRQEDGSTIDAATVAFNLLNVRLTQSEQRPRAHDRDRLTKQALEVLAEAQSLERPTIVATTHRVLADLTRASNPDAAADHLNRCLELEASLQRPRLRASCLWTLSLVDADRDPGRADRASREALGALSTNPAAHLLAYAWQARLRLVWKTMPRHEAISASLPALDAIERLRAKQTDEESRAALFGNWTRDYYWLTGRLLEANTPDVARAFEVGERLRARVLLEHLARARLQQTTGTPEPERLAARHRVRQAIVETQRRLLDSGLASDRRHALLDQLRLLEIEERDLSTASATVAAPAIPVALDAIQQALGTREALLWYSIAPWQDLYGDFGGGAWLLVVTRQQVRVHRLSSATDLDTRVAALAGLLSDRDAAIDSWEPAAANLSRMLFGTALVELPPDIDRLSIISDGELHRLPFEVLRPAAGLPRVGERFELTVVPSATLWLRLRRSTTPSISNTTLVLADPELSRGDPSGVGHLAPLPWARREADWIARTLRLDADHVHKGTAASERFLKEASLERYAVLHLAAHARADESFPDRSAVFLAPGSADEDGWLQPREIAALNLGGQLVVLSACESASGFLLSGEGPLSLARAFFAGGAGGVVASRWPLRDDDAAFVMERFYRALGTGVGAAAALRQARLEAIRGNRPAAVWAGVALLGDGSKPMLRRVPSAVVSRLVLGSLVLAVFALMLIGLLRTPLQTTQKSGL
jgi:hypothetical protein